MLKCIFNFFKKKNPVNIHPEEEMTLDKFVKFAQTLTETNRALRQKIKLQSPEGQTKELTKETVQEPAKVEQIDILKKQIAELRALNEEKSREHNVSKEDKDVRHSLMNKTQATPGIADCVDFILKHLELIEPGHSFFLRDMIRLFFCGKCEEKMLTESFFSAKTSRAVRILKAKHQDKCILENPGKGPHKKWMITLKK